ncbi:MAG: molybdopterin dinucleotide binding domain-containing protein [Parabacteroides sp.]|nr:molybdopterin dinucleotide binding domain-containing protein [Parabacteroides sp.]
MNYSSPEDIFTEIRKVTPSYAGISYQRIDNTGIPWPCPTEEHPGTPILHGEKFSRGLGLFHAIEFKEAHELPDAEYPLILSTGRSLFHYQTGTMTRRSSAALNEFRPSNEVQVNPKTAARVNIVDNEMVKLITCRGHIEVETHITEMIPDGVVFTFFHFSEAAANVLTQAKCLDPVAKIPEYKVSAARIDKI